MKRFLIVFLFFISGIIFGNNEYHVSVQNDMLVFEQAQDYYKVIRDLNPTQKVEFVSFLTKNLAFNSLAKNPNSKLYEEFNDGYFDYLLNKDGFVQIGSYIYKLDLLNESVAVINSSNVNSTILDELIKGEYMNEYIRVYSFDDEVIGMVETDTPPSNAKLFCGESGCGADHDDETIDVNSPNTGTECGTMYGIVRYVRGGIYFKLYAECNNYCGATRMYWHEDPVAYKQKCGYTHGPVSQWGMDSGYNGGASNVWNKTYYINVQPLNAFHLRVVFMAKDALWIANPINPSMDLRIRKNM